MDIFGGCHCSSAAGWGVCGLNDCSDGTGKSSPIFEYKELIALQDEVYLQVIRTSGDASERKHAARVLRLLKKGKHWVLVTLLLSNVITNETLPIVLDRSLGGGWPAVLGSTALIGTTMWNQL